jgi:hypothetical protein
MSKGHHGACGVMSNLSLFLGEFIGTAGGEAQHALD